MSKELMVKGDFTINTYDLWNKLNWFRIEAKESKIRHDDFISRVEDECDDLGVCENFAHPQNKQKMSMYTLNRDQTLLVGMRESKTVRKQVLKWLNDLSKPKTIEEMQKELLIAYEQRDLEKTRSINHGYKSVIGRKSSIINDTKDILEVKRDKDVVGAVRELKEDYYTPTIIGKSIGLSARRMNQELKDNGYQDKVDGMWVSTEKGKPFSIQHKQNIDGTVRYSVRWLMSVIEDMDI